MKCPRMLFYQRLTSRMEYKLEGEVCCALGDTISVCISLGGVEIGGTVMSETLPLPMLLGAKSS